MDENNDQHACDIAAPNQQALSQHEKRKNTVVPRTTTTHNDRASTLRPAEKKIQPTSTIH
jgi:hypothetical protein